jgi:hypothetical protein
MVRSHELLGADGAGAHVPPTHVHCPSQEFTVRWVIADENRPRVLRPAPNYGFLAGTYSRMTMPALNALVSLKARIDIGMEARRGRPAPPPTKRIDR